MSRVVVVGAGPIGLATAMLLARDGHEVRVLENDPQAPPATAAEAWDRWERGGVAQFRQLHIMHAKFRHLLDAELPQVRDQIAASGGRRFNLIEILPRSVTDRSPRQGDDRFETLTGRRPLLEHAFARVAEETPGVTIERGVAVEGPLTGASVRRGIPHVTGVRTHGGAEIGADLVIDAMGRRSKLCDWVVAIGGRPPYEEATDAGFAYYTRHYRSRDGSVPEHRGPLGARIGTIAVGSILADNNTWTLAIVPMAGDRPFRALRHNEVWERVARTIPHVVHWLDGEPLSDVMPMAGTLDRYRRIVVDGQPVVTGLLPVGDAWACTNPNAGRGVSLGLAHAITLRDTLRDTLREHSDDPARLGMEYDRVTEETLTPWYRDQVDQDNELAAEVQATIDGRPPASSADDPAKQLQAALFTAASADADVARARFDVMSCLALPAEVLARPGIREKVAAYVGVEPPQLPGPSRAELLALVS
jgi:2-polyprenyl-6-methoxyphenol hydroxylase-like FAD-dependent oxidoreductase